METTDIIALSCSAFCWFCAGACTYGRKHPGCELFSLKASPTILMWPAITIVSLVNSISNTASEE